MKACGYDQLGAKPTHAEDAMNWAELEGDWKGMSPVLKAYWTKLTDEDLERIAGRREWLAATLRTLYGYGEAEAERAIAAFEKDVRFPGPVK
jgi:uncharacterized protein YjbJ (UPF0337 family)